MTLPFGRQFSEGRLFLVLQTLGQVQQFETLCLLEVKQNLAVPLFLLVSALFGESLLFRQTVFEQLPRALRLPVPICEALLDAQDLSLFLSQGMSMFALGLLQLTLQQLYLALELLFQLHLDLLDLFFISRLLVVLVPAGFLHGLDDVLIGVFRLLHLFLGRYQLLLDELFVLSDQQDLILHLGLKHIDLLFLLLQIPLVSQFDRGVTLFLIQSLDLLLETSNLREVCLVHQPAFPILFLEIESECFHLLVCLLLDALLHVLLLVQLHRHLVALLL